MLDYTENENIEFEISTDNYYNTNITNDIEKLLVSTSRLLKDANACDGGWGRDAAHIRLRLSLIELEKEITQIKRNVRISKHKKIK